MELDDTYYWNGPLPETQAPSTTPDPWAETKIVGKPIVRVDAFERVSGTAVYPSDVALPDMLHAAILSCPHAHAIAKKVDTSAAEKMPGVRAVLKDGVAGTNIPWFGGPGGAFASRLFDPHVRYHGEEVAAVAADTIYQAWDAVRAIQVEWEVLPQVTTVTDAAKPDAPKVRDDGNKPAASKPYVRGDVAAGFKAADVVVEHTFRTPCELHSPMELHGCVAKWDGQHLTIWESTQGVYAVQSTVARALNLPLATIRVIGHYVGGGFGAKLDTGKYSVIASLLARKTRRPVRLFLTREQTAQTQGNRPGGVISVKLGAKKDGTLVAIQSSAIGTGGAYAGAGGMDYVMRELYACPNVLCENQNVYTHAMPQRAFRAPGHPQAAWALEGAMDSLAAKLGVDPLDLRKKNFAVTSPSRNIPYTSNGLLRCYDDGAAAFGWKAARTKASQPGHIKRGVGVAAGMWQGGNGGPPATIIVKLFSDGSANINMGAADIGCGTKTWAAQIVSEELGMPVEKISIEYADTGTTQFATPSGGSKTVPTESPAIRAAAVDVKQQLLAMAAEQQKLPIGDLEMRGTDVVSKSDPTKKVAIGQLRTFGSRGLIVGVGYRGPNPPGKATNPWGVQFAEVEVNTKTGEIKVLRFLAAHDSGRILNTKTFQNQVFGGVTMGIGFGLTEDRILDDKQLGKTLTSNLHDYKVPTALDAPADKALVIVDPRDTEFSSTGAKGVGEPATIPTAPAIANAVFHATGVRMTDAPMTPARVLQALAAASQVPSKNQKGGK